MDPVLNAVLRFHQHQTTTPFLPGPPVEAATQQAPPAQKPPERKPEPKPEPEDDPQPDEGESEEEEEDK